MLYIIIYLITILSLILLFTLFILVTKPLIYGVNEYTKIVYSLFIVAKKALYLRAFSFNSRNV